MFEKFADKATQIFSRKALENTKKAIVEDVKENQTGYVMAGISGLIIATAVIVAVKAIIGAVPTPSTPMYSITYNYYINLPKMPEV
jgi:hypothetical protein